MEANIFKKKKKKASYLYSWAPQCHFMTVWLRKVLCMRVCMDMVAGVCVSMVCVHHRGLWGVQGAGH